MSVINHRLNPIQILLSCPSSQVGSNPNPTVISAIICRIPSKSYCLVCHFVQNPIQILLSCLPLYAKSHLVCYHTQMTIKILLTLKFHAFHSRILLESQGPSRLKIISRSVSGVNNFGSTKEIGSTFFGGQTYLGVRKIWAHKFWG